MARPGGQDRGLYSRTNTQGEARWYVRIAAEGRMRTFAPHGGFPTDTEAREFLENTRTDLRRGKFFPESFIRRILPLETLLEQQEARRSKTPNRKNDRQYQKWWIAHYGDRDVRLLSPSLLEEARQTLTQVPLSPQTVHHYLKFLRHALNLALRDELIDRSPFQHIRLPPVHNQRVRQFSPEERQALYTALGPIWREAAELAGLTGLRWSEQFRLERKHLHLEQESIVLSHTKAGAPQARFLGRRGVELVRRQLARAKHPRWLYPNTARTRPVQYRSWYRWVWKKATTKAGLTNAHWHDWRHTFASDLTARGHSDRTVAALLGHTSTQMVKRYAHLAPSHLKEAVNSLGTANQLRTRQKYKKNKTA